MAIYHQYWLEAMKHKYFSKGHESVSNTCGYGYASDIIGYAFQSNLFFVNPLNFGYMGICHGIQVGYVAILCTILPIYIYIIFKPRILFFFAKLLAYPSCMVSVAENAHVYQFFITPSSRLNFLMKFGGCDLLIVQIVSTISLEKFIHLPMHN